MPRVTIRMEVFVSTIVELTFDLNDEDVDAVRADDDPDLKPSVQRAHMQADLSFRDLCEIMEEDDFQEMNRLILEKVDACPE